MKRIAILLTLIFLVSGCYSTDDTNFRSFTIEKANQIPAEQREVKYIGNFNSKKFHYPYCESVQHMKEENKDFLRCSSEDAIKIGYKPCKICNPSE